MKRRQRAVAWFSAASLLFVAFECSAQMTDLSQRYVKLVLAVGVHDPDYVDAYYGPAEWRTEAQHAKVPLAEIEAAATDLAGDLKAITPAPSEVGLPRLRHSFVARQLESLRARITMLQGRKMRFDEESQALYDAVAPPHTEEEFLGTQAELGQRLPKGFLRLGERPIVEESLDRLTAAGIERTLIVTGHQRGFYEDLRLARPASVTTVHNPRFAESGSMLSLWTARELLTEDFLLLESDLVYEPRALSELLAHPAPDVLLVSGPTAAGDEVWVEAEEGRLTGMSKDRSRLARSIVGELVGITKVSQALFAEMVKLSECLFRETLKVDYETDALVQAGRVRPIACHLVPDLVWAEIDDEHHLARAREQVYPRIGRLAGRA